MIPKNKQEGPDTHTHTQKYEREREGERRDENETEGEKVTLNSYSLSNKKFEGGKDYLLKEYDT